MIYEPDKINEIMTKKGTVQLPPLVYILPWQTQSFDMNFMDKEQLEKQANIINDWILEIEKCDPWVKSTFGIEGIGEGISFLYRLTVNRFSSLSNRFSKE